MGAVTLSIPAPTPKYTMVIDHPFLFFIAHKRTGAPIFIGRIVDLSHIALTPSYQASSLDDRNRLGQSAQQPEYVPQVTNRFTQPPQQRHELVQQAVQSNRDRSPNRQNSGVQPQYVQSNYEQAVQPQRQTRPQTQSQPQQTYQASYPDQTYRTQQEYLEQISLASQQKYQDVMNQFNGNRRSKTERRERGLVFY